MNLKIIIFYQLFNSPALDYCCFLLVLVAIIRLATATTATTMTTKIVRSSVFPLVVRELVAVGVGVWVAWGAVFPCCWAYTEAGIAPGLANGLGLGALVVEPVPSVVVAV